MIFIFYLYRHIALSHLFLLLVTVLISPLMSFEVFVCVYICMPVSLCLTVTNLSSLLNSLRDLPENATSLLLGSLLHIKGVALNRVCVRREWKCANVQQKFSFVVPTVKPNSWHQKQLHNCFTSLVWQRLLWVRKKEPKTSSVINAP